MKEKYLYDKKMYDFTAGCYSGVIMPKEIMKKILKLNYKYESELKKILNDNKKELFVSDWTLANQMDGEKIKKQVTIKYALKNNPDIDYRIQSYSYTKPEYIKDFYLVDVREQAEQIAQEVLQEEIEKDNNKKMKKKFEDKGDK